MRRTLAVVVAAALICGGCGEDRAPAPTPASAPPRATAAEAGMCAEHGVLEAVCTKCNPALIPVFQAKGDWCAEHGLPESFCPICHPAQGGRPANVVESDGAPADGTMVRFKTLETARLAGLEYAEAVAVESTGLEVTVTARIVYDATKRAEVNARAQGVVRSVAADVGTPVRAGSTLAEIESAELGIDESRALAARSQLEVAEANHERLAKLFAQGIVPEQELLEAKREVDEARSELVAIQATLDMVAQGGGRGSRYALTAPLAGVVTLRTASVGRYVDTEQVLFEIVDTSSMWAELDIPEGDLPRVAVGQSVRLTFDVLGGRELLGRLVYIEPSIDAHTRTAKGRVPLTNPEGVLRDNMFARAHIAVGGAGATVTVPREAVQNARGASLVFVRLAEDTFEARRVELGAEEGAWIAVRGRVAAGDRVVTTGSFLLKTETLAGSIGAGCCDVEARD